MVKTSFNGAMALVCLFICAAAPNLAWAQSVSADTARAESAPVIDPNTLQSRLGLWQDRLNLKDWKITIVMKRRAELKPKTLGQVHWDKSKKSAVIWIQHACDYNLPAAEILRDMEFTVVHELLHLKFASSRRSEASRRAEEHAVNHIAEALLRLDYQLVAKQ